MGALDPTVAAAADAVHTAHDRGSLSLVVELSTGRPVDEDDLGAVIGAIGNGVTDLLHDLGYSDVFLTITQP